MWKGGRVADTSMMCVRCKNLALHAPGLSCGITMCGACCLALKHTKDGDDVPLAVGTLIACVCEPEDSVCVVETLVDRGLERRMADSLEWECTCGDLGTFNKVAAYEEHLHTKCPNRPVACLWCGVIDRAVLTALHQPDCNKREGTCSMCALNMPYWQLGGHECKKGCVGPSCDAHLAVCRREIVKCDACPLECPLEHLEAHRNSDVTCLRAQLATARAPQTKWSSWTNDRPRQRIPFGIALDFFSDNMQIGRRVLARFSWSSGAYIAGEVVASAAGNKWLVNADGFSTTDDEWFLCDRLFDLTLTKAKELRPF